MLILLKAAKIRAAVGVRSPWPCGQRVWSCGVAVTVPFEASLYPELPVPLSSAQGTALVPSLWGLSHSHHCPCCSGSLSGIKQEQREGESSLTLQVVWSCLLFVWKELNFNHRITESPEQGGTHRGHQVQLLAYPGTLV